MHFHRVFILLCVFVLVNVSVTLCCDYLIGRCVNKIDRWADRKTGKGSAGIRAHRQAHRETQTDRQTDTQTDIFFAHPWNVPTYYLEQLRKMEKPHE